MTNELWSERIPAAIATGEQLLSDGRAYFGVGGVFVSRGEVALAKALWEAIGLDGDTMLHPFVGDGALCNECGEHGTWHPVYVAPLRDFTEKMEACHD